MEISEKPKKKKVAQEKETNFEEEVIGSVENEQRRYDQLEKEEKQEEIQKNLETIDKNIEKELEDYLESESELEQQSRLSLYSQTIQQGHCGLCRVQVEGKAFTSMNCGQHVFHNWCAHSFIGVAALGPNDCILCSPKRMPVKVFSSPQTKNLDDSVRATAVNFGDQIFVDEQVEARSVLFQSLGAYTINFTLGSILAKTAIGAHDEIPVAPSVAVSRRVIDFIGDALDINYYKQKEEEQILDHNGNPLELIRKRSLTVAQLAQRGVSASALLFYRVSIEEFFKNDYTVEHLAILGLTKDQLFALGLDWNVLKRYRKRISVVQLVNFYRMDTLTLLTFACNRSIKNFADIGFSFEEHKLLQTDFTVLFTLSGFDLETLKLFRIELRQLRMLRLLPQHLLRANISLRRILECFPTIKEDEFIKMFQMSFHDYETSLARMRKK